MTTVRDLADWIVWHWLPDSVDRLAVSETTAAVLETATLSTKVREVHGLVALGLEVRYRHATNGNTRRVLAHGLGLGTALTLLLAITEAAGLHVGVTTISAVVIPAALLLAGWHDPRLAVSAVTIWTERLAIADHVAFFSDLAALGNGLSLSGLVIQWFVMALGALTAAAFTNMAMKRAARI